MHRALADACSHTAAGIAAAKFGGDLVGAVDAEMRQYCFAGIAHGLGGRLVAKIYAILLPDLRDRVACLRLKEMGSAIDVYCLGFCSNPRACLKLMPNAAALWVVPIDAEAAAEASDADVWHDSISSTTSCGMR